MDNTGQATVTAINARLSLEVPGIYDTAFVIDQFSADNIFTADPEPNVETEMTVDGWLFGGLVHVAKPMSIRLSAASRANIFFENWNAAQYALSEPEVYVANGMLMLKATGRKARLRRGFLTSFQRLPEGARTLQPRTHIITWQNIDLSPA